LLRSPEELERASGSGGSPDPPPPHPRNLSDLAAGLGVDMFGPARRFARRAGGEPVDQQQQPLSLVVPHRDGRVQLVDPPVPVAGDEGVEVLVVDLPCHAGRLGEVVKGKGRLSGDQPGQLCEKTERQVIVATEAT
jgi:hypothetical protein